MPIPCDDDQVARCDCRNPVRVEHAEWALGDELVSRVDGVLAGGLQCLAQPQRALIHVEAEVIAVGGHGPSGAQATVASAAAPLARRNS
jgi:hypothetical protein